MDKEIKVSVYCLAYNHEKYIRDCLEGFVNQKTDFKYEVIVHDDASTDGTTQIIKEYVDKYPYLIKAILQKENQYSKGVRIFRKFILPKMKGKYVAVCEGDDYWCDCNKLQKQFDILENNNRLVACVHQTKSIDYISGKSSFVSKIKESGIIDNVKILSSDGPVYHTSSLFYRKELLDNIPDFCKICKSIDDYPWGIWFALEGNIFYINEVMSVYRMFTVGSWSYRTKINENNIVLYEEIVKMLKCADEYSDYKFHEYFDIPILNYEYRCWKAKPEFSILKNKRFSKLKTSKKLKLFLRMLF